MFTGLVEEMGEVAGIERGVDSVRLSVRASKVLEDAELGHSILVAGVCLTVAELDGDLFTADVMQETLNRTALGSLEPGSRVNLERALAVSDRLGGHVVQGHVDAVVTLLSRTPGDRWDVLRFSLPQNLAHYVVEKGSITLDGTSLTVSAVSEDYFEVSLIPVTLNDTTHGNLTVGGSVNLEVDVLAKYVEKQLSHRMSGMAPGEG